MAKKLIKLNVNKELKADGNIKWTWVDGWHDFKTKVSIFLTETVPSLTVGTKWTDVVIGVVDEKDLTSFTALTGVTEIDLMEADTITSNKDFNKKTSTTITDKNAVIAVCEKIAKSQVLTQEDKDAVDGSKIGTAGIVTRTFDIRDHM